MELFVVPDIGSPSSITGGRVSVGGSFFANSSPCPVLPALGFLAAWAGWMRKLGELCETS